MPTLYRGYGGHVLEKFAVNTPLVVLGRDDACDIVLKGTGVSRQHCQLVQSPEGYYVEDMGSSNGTLLNGERLSGRRLLREGDKIAVMGHVFTFKAEDEPPLVKFQPLRGAVPSEEQHPPTKEVDPAELRRRLSHMFPEDLKPSQGVDEGKEQ